MLETVGLVDVEGQIFLKLLNLALGNLASLEVLLRLRLQSSIRLHQIVVEFDQLLHLMKRVTGHLSLVTHLVLGCLLLGILVSSDKCLVLTSQKHNTLLVLHLCLNLLFVKGINLLPLQIKVNAD